MMINTMLLLQRTKLKQIIFVIAKYTTTHELCEQQLNYIISDNPYPSLPPGGKEGKSYTVDHEILNLRKKMLKY